MLLVDGKKVLTGNMVPEDLTGWYIEINDLKQNTDYELKVYYKNKLLDDVKFKTKLEPVRFEVENYTGLVVNRWMLRLKFNFNNSLKKILTIKAKQMPDYDGITKSIIQKLNKNTFEKCKDLYFTIYTWEKFEATDKTDIENPSINNFKKELFVPYFVKYDELTDSQKMLVNDKHLYAKCRKLSEKFQNVMDERIKQAEKNENVKMYDFDKKIDVVDLTGLVKGSSYDLSIVYESIDGLTWSYDVFVK